MNLFKMALLLLSAVLSACASTPSNQASDALSVPRAGDDGQASWVLNDIWALESIGKKPFVLETSQRPQLEIHLREMTLNGHDGCNHFFASIEFVDDQTISFGPIGSTRMYCQPMDLPDRFNQHFNRTASYALEGLTLRLLDAEGKELLQFRKID